MLHIPRWQAILVVIGALAGPLLTLPNFFTKEQLAPIAAYLPTPQMTLGLDLQGGAHLVYEADMKQAGRERLEQLRKDVRLVLRPQTVSADKSPISFRDLHITEAGLQVKIVAEDRREDAVKRIKELAQPIKLSGAWGTTIPEFDVVQTEGGLITLTMNEQAVAAQGKQVMDQAIEVMRRRIDAFGTREPTIVKQGSDQIVVQVAGEKDVSRLKNEIGKMARLTFHMVDMTADPNVAVTPLGKKTLPLDDAEGGRLVVDETPLLSGQNLTEASLQTDERGQAAVGFTFDAVGSRKFAEITRANVGKLFAVVLDDKIITAPRIQTEIAGGKGIITGNFTNESAGNLALLLRAGALPVPMTVVEERTVGPELGADSIEAGKTAFIVAFLLVAGFMAMYYGRMGIYAGIALVVNTLLVTGFLSLFGATLTLPGIAGIVLGMGMAVDANVLINERIREELRSGQSIIKAVDTGYTRAWDTIFDSHVTGFVAAAIMFVLGVGPIRGFAVTLTLGIVASLFTSVWVTRLMMGLWIKRKRPTRLTFGLSGS